MAIVPIIEEIVNIVLAWMEYFKILPSKLVLKGNNELADLQSETQEHNTYAIGFDYPILHMKKPMITMMNKIL